MDNLKKIVLKSIARNVCRLTGSKKPYRKIRGLARKSNKDFLKSNCHGFTVYMLGLNGGNSDSPKEKSSVDMDTFLTDYCYRSQEHNGLIIAFREGDGFLDHTAISYPTPQGTFMLHQLNRGSPFEITTLTSYLDKNPSLKTEASIEFHKYFPDGMNTSGYSSRPSFNPNLNPNFKPSCSPGLGPF